MPHQCTNCGHTFPDGSKEMLSGCPDCGGNKFQFKPAGTSDDQPTTQSASQQQPTQPKPTGESSESTPGPKRNPKSKSKSKRKPESEPEAGVDQSGFVSKEPKDADESPAQSSARSDVVSPDELTAAGTAQPANGPDSPGSSSQPNSPADQSAESADSAASAEQPTEHTTEQSSDSTADDSSGSSLDELRKELNNQFESIRIVSPGQYELNLMELYDREEYIISLREDGRYVIEVPDSWGEPEDA